LALGLAIFQGSRTFGTVKMSMLTSLHQPSGCLLC
jgi:hypothetical protein